MDMQAMIDGLAARWQRERAGSQMTLGGLIAALEAMPPEAMVANLSGPASYRGYYCDIAFSHGAGNIRAEDLLAECRAAMGKVFEGYKGGEYMMGANTPVWIADYGDCGERLLSIGADGEIETGDDD